MKTTIFIILLFSQWHMLQAQETIAENREFSVDTLNVTNSPDCQFFPDEPDYFKIESYNAAPTNASAPPTERRIFKRKTSENNVATKDNGIVKKKAK